MTDTRSNSANAIMMAGCPDINDTIYHRIRHWVPDTVVYLQIANQSVTERTLILRDIEMERARGLQSIDVVSCPAEFEPVGGLSGDRETANAQAAAECLIRAGVKRVWVDATLPYLFAHHLIERGIEVCLDPDLGVEERRRKDEQEIAWLREAQAATESAIRLACEMIAHADVAGDGTLNVGGEVLTSERVRSEVDVHLMKLGYRNQVSIIAGGPTGSDCHDVGSGPLRTGEPVIVDIFPRNISTRYNGDCTRTVVHGEVSDTLRAMHAAVVAAKQAAIATTRAGVTGEQVHEQTVRVIKEHGFAFGLPTDEQGDDYCAMVHGTGHGIGLAVHEPPILNVGGPELVAGDAITIEPGLYRRDLGGIRVEDMVIVTDEGCENLNALPESLEWK